MRLLQEITNQKWYRGIARYYYLRKVHAVAADAVLVQPSNSHRHINRLVGSVLESDKPKLHISRNTCVQSH